MLHLCVHGPRPLENYRIHVVPIYLPPLRERPADIPLLAQHFLQRFTHETVKAGDGFSPDALQQMMMYEWPCNVRELANVVERAVVLATNSQIFPDHLHLGKRKLESSRKRAADLQRSPAAVRKDVFVPSVNGG